ncbi:hypothetical protein G7K_1517-t1 [Saitoella complicata NRRL Y-17804]|uniref:Zn(2)-C6 fungal-type domain-containing protein n=1 Tax=Saitoella complicata (strain BCRC 22490 / CBS 7301 / JCM 7358 / NBRC 10748 / NRRL Y-17804) TaxID=698492 RepID=A0A0E9NBW6_SAICN|nr:hypothetical protein G7K_1517-t1 [Saitoella complicata NRRL Y-17804]
MCAGPSCHIRMAIDGQLPSASASHSPAGFSRPSRGPPYFSPTSTIDNLGYNSGTEAHLSGFTGGGPSANPLLNVRRQRASRACETCHARKVRCDAATLGIPCTNCSAFGIDCKIAVTRKKAQLQKSKSSENEGPLVSPVDEVNRQLGEQSGQSTRRTSMASSARPSISPNTSTDKAEHLQAKKDMSDIYLEQIREGVDRVAINDAAFLGESSNLHFVEENFVGADGIHPGKGNFFPIPPRAHKPPGNVKLVILDEEELNHLKSRGVFLIPPRDVCDDLVTTYFEHVHAAIPVINKTEFMRRYNDPSHPPPILLLQAIFFVASRMSDHPALREASTGTNTASSFTFWKRAKLLYDAGAEKDKMVVLQALILMSFPSLETDDECAETLWHALGLAIRLAQGLGIYRKPPRNLSLTDRRLWKRIFWTLYTRDRTLCVALGRPLTILMEDCEVEPLQESDFLEEEVEDPFLEYPPNPQHTHFFMQHVKLCEIMEVVMRKQYTAGSSQKRLPPDISISDRALATWLMNLPKEMQYPYTLEGTEQNPWAACLHSTYYGLLCLLHRPYVTKTAPPSHASTSSRYVAFSAANMITRIMENLLSCGRIKYGHSFIVYATFSAMIFHAMEIRAPDTRISEGAKKKFSICMKSLRELSKVWGIAAIIFRLFEMIQDTQDLESKMTIALRADPFQNASQTLAETAQPAPKRTTSQTTQASAADTQEMLSAEPPHKHTSRPKPRRHASGSGSGTSPLAFQQQQQQQQHPQQQQYTTGHISPHRQHSLQSSSRPHSHSVSSGEGYLASFTSSPGAGPGGISPQAAQHQQSPVQQQQQQQQQQRQQTIDPASFATGPQFAEPPIINAPNTLKLNPMDFYLVTQPVAIHQDLWESFEPKQQLFPDAAPTQEFDVAKSNSQSPQGFAMLRQTWSQAGWNPERGQEGLLNPDPMPAYEQGQYIMSPQEQQYMAQPEYFTTQPLTGTMYGQPGLPGVPAIQEPRSMSVSNPSYNQGMTGMDQSPQMGEWYQPQVQTSTGQSPESYRSYGSHQPH